MASDGSVSQIPIKPGQSVYGRYCIGGCGKILVVDVSAHHAPQHQNPDEIRFVGAWVRKQFLEVNEPAHALLERYQNQINHELTRGQKGLSIEERIVSSKELRDDPTIGGWYTIQGDKAICFLCKTKLTMRMEKKTQQIELDMLDEIKNENE